MAQRSGSSAPAARAASACAADAAVPAARPVTPRGAVDQRAIGSAPAWGDAWAAGKPDDPRDLGPADHPPLRNPDHRVSDRFAGCGPAFGAASRRAARYRDRWECEIVAYRLNLECEELAADLRRCAHEQLVDAVGG